MRFLIPKSPSDPSNSFIVIFSDQQQQPQVPHFRLKWENPKSTAEQKNAVLLCIFTSTPHRPPKKKTSLVQQKKEYPPPIQLSSSQESEEAKRETNKNVCFSVFAAAFFTH